jgi:hypothetical protein
MLNNSDTVQKVVIQIELVRFYAIESYDLVTIATWSLKRQWIKVTSDVIEEERKIKSNTQHMNTEHTQSINNQQYALNYITSLFNIQAPTCFSSSVPSSGSFLDPCELLEIQIK